MRDTKAHRLDDILVARQLATSKTQAKALIMAGLVFHKSTRLDKPGQKVSRNISICVRKKAHPWVSRGGVKLAHALQTFQISVSGKICIDVGASTGGFTDVLLFNGAQKVYAIDSGTGQLDWKLRNNKRVIVHEKTNARYLTQLEIPERVGIITCDASFISLRTILPTPLSFAENGSFLVALIKPQFEAGREHVGKGGVIRDPSIHTSVCKEVLKWLTTRSWSPLGIERSPIKGPKGNTEFLVAAKLKE